MARSGVLGAVFFVMCFIFNNFLGSYVDMRFALGVSHDHGSVRLPHQYRMEGIGSATKELIQFR